MSTQTGEQSPRTTVQDPDVSSDRPKSSDRPRRLSATRDDFVPGSWSDRINYQYERAFNGIGNCVGKNPGITCCMTFAVLIAFAVGPLFAAKLYDTPLDLWVERGSRLIDEMAFIEDNFEQNFNRNQYLLFSDDGNDVTTASRMQEHLDQIEYVITNSAVQVDDLNYDWFTLCDRDQYLGLPMPCKYYSVFQCFKEGGRDLAFDEQWLRMYYSALNMEMVIPNQYITKSGLSGSDDWKNRYEIGALYCNGWKDDVVIPEAATMGEPFHVEAELLKVVMEIGFGNSYWNNDGTVKAVPGTSTSTPVLTTILKECWNRWVKHDNASFVAYPDSASYGSMAATVSGWIDDNSDSGVTYEEWRTWFLTDIPATEDPTSEYAFKTNLRKWINWHPSFERIRRTMDPVVHDRNDRYKGKMPFTQITNATALMSTFGIQSEIALATLIGGCLNDDGSLKTGDQTPQLTQEYINSIKHGFYDSNLTLTPKEVDEYLCYRDRSQLSVDQIQYAKDILLKYEDHWLDNANRAQGISTAQTDRYSSRTINDLESEAADANVSLIMLGYVTLIAFVAVSLGSGSPWRSRIFIGLLGILMIVLSVAAAFGLWSYCGLEITPSQMQILPLLALGLGADNVFVLVMNTVNEEGKEPHTILAENYQKSLSSITLTSFTNAICFLVCALMPLPQLSYFGGSAIMVIFFNWIVVTFGLGPLIVWDLKRQNDGRADCFVCRKVSKDYRDLESKSNIGLFYTYLLTPAGIIITLVSFISVACVAAYGITEMGVGLRLSDALPEDHYATSFLSSREDYFTLHGTSLYLGRGFKDGKSKAWEYNQPEGLAILHKQLVPAMSELDQANPILNFDVITWLHPFEEYLYRNDNYEYKSSFVEEESLYYECFDSTEESANPITVADFDAAVTGCFDVKCVSFTWNEVNKQYKPCTYVYTDDDDDLWWKNSEAPWVVTREESGWVTIIPAILAKEVGFVDIVDGFFKTEAGVSASKSVIYNADKSEIIGIETSAAFDVGYGTEEWEKCIKDTRSVTDNSASWWQDDKSTRIPVFPNSFYFSLMEQYLNVADYLHISLLAALLCAGLVLFFFLLSFKAALAVFISLLLVAVDVYGFSHFADLTLNGLMALNIVVAVGIAVEFNAHFARFYMLSSSSHGPNKNPEGHNDVKSRIILAAEAVFLPVTLAAISTLLGVFPVAFTSFPYFRDYFFLLYVYIILFSWLHGLVFLPVLLYLLAPGKLQNYEDDSENDSNIENVVRTDLIE